MPIRHLLSVTFLALALLSGCQPVPAKPATLPPPESKIQVVTTTLILADLVENICGERCEVTSIIPAGIDPHSYKIAPEDAEELKKADLIFKHGFGLEETMESGLAEFDDKTIDLSQSIDPKEVIDTNGVPDPHIWLDPRLWQQASGGVASAFIARYPDWGAYIEGKNVVYGFELTKLEHEMEETLARIPASNRKIFTSHTGFAYLARRFGYENHSLHGSTSVNKLDESITKNFVEKIVASGLTAVFMEPTIDPLEFKVIQKAAQSKGVSLRIAGELYADSLPGGKSYLETMRINAKSIVGGIGY